MFVNEPLPTTCLHKIETAIAAWATVATPHWYEIETTGNGYCIARQVEHLAQLLRRPYERDCRSLTANREHYEFATFYGTATHHLVHQHPIASPEPLAYWSWHGIDGEGKHTDDHNQSHGCRKSDDEFDNLPSQNLPSNNVYYYLMLSTILNKRFHLTRENPLRSGSELHQMNIGLPTIWSSGTKPQ